MEKILGPSARQDLTGPSVYGGDKASAPRRGETDPGGQARQWTSVEQIQKAAKQAQELAQAFDRSLRFDIKQEAGLVQVSVVDTARDKVVRKIPPDYIVHFVEHVREMFGALLDTEA